MRKEVLFAIIIGFVLAGVILLGFKTARQALQNSAAQKQSTLPAEEAPQPTPPPAIFLTIISPENDSISNQEKIEITGTTKPLAVISVIYEEGEEIVEADEEGNFSLEITLVGGSNEIKISAHDIEGNEASENLYLVYSTAEI
jgi:hypothetical protein